MSMRGEIISKEYQRMIFVDDKDGKEYACYQEDLDNFYQKRPLSEEEKSKCTNLSDVLGDTW